MAKKSSKKKKKVDNSKILVPIVLLIAIIAVILIVLFTPNPVMKDCAEYCVAQGYRGAVSPECTVFTQCMAPNYPLTDSNVDKYCKGDFDVCCCEQ